MSYNSKSYLAHEEQLQEPSIIVTGTRRRYSETSMAAKNRYFNGLSDAERSQLASEYEQEQEKLKYKS